MRNDTVFQRQNSLLCKNGYKIIKVRVRRSVMNLRFESTKTRRCHLCSPRIAASSPSVPIYTILNFTVLIVKQSYKVMNVIIS